MASNSPWPPGAQTAAIVVGGGGGGGVGAWTALDPSTATSFVDPGGLLTGQPTSTGGNNWRVTSNALVSATVNSWSASAVLQFTPPAEWTDLTTADGTPRKLLQTELIFAGVPGGALGFQFGIRKAAANDAVGTYVGYNGGTLWRGGTTNSWFGPVLQSNTFSGAMTHTSLFTPVGPFDGSLQSGFSVTQSIIQQSNDTAQSSGSSNDNATGWRITDGGDWLFGVSQQAGALVSETFDFEFRYRIIDLGA